MRRHGATFEYHSRKGGLAIAKVDGIDNLGPRKEIHQKRHYAENFSIGSRWIKIFAVFAVVFILGVHIYLLNALSLFRSGEDEITMLRPNQLFDRTKNDTFSEGKSLTILRDIDREHYTIRINTWKRPEQLQVSINHHSTCPGVSLIQVVWCLEQGEPPEDILSNPKVVVERHEVNSLNERFNIIEETPTLGILSIDDDLLRPCEAIDSGFLIWTRNPERMVGFDARSHVSESETWKYAYKSATEKSNQYSMTLPRYCFIHRDYLNWYMMDLPKHILQSVSESFNCEDIAMSLFVSSLTGGKPPLLADFWAVNTMVKLYVPTGISSTSGHKKVRDQCVDTFANSLRVKGKLRHAKLFHHSVFEYGEKGKESNSMSTGRLGEFIHHVVKWKKMHQDHFFHELEQRMRSMSKEAYVQGLLEKTKPWKQRWQT